MISNTEYSTFSADESHEELKATPQPLPVSVYDNLPIDLAKICSQATTESERGTLLVGSLGVLSGCLPGIYGLYDARKVYPNTYSYIIAPPGTGKGVLGSTKKLAEPIHNMLFEKVIEEDFDEDDNDDDDCSDDNIPQKKPLKEMLLMPANITSTGFVELLQNNKRGSIMHESEGIVLSEAFNSMHGGFRSSILKTYHHEPISLYRRGKKEYITIPDPRLSIVISSTPPQVRELIPSVHDGLASRFLFYCPGGEPKMKDVFKNSNAPIDDFFEKKGRLVLNFYNRLTEQGGDVCVSLTDKQKKIFNSIFEAWHNKFHVLYGADSLSIPRRLGLSTFRICMILTALRHLRNHTIPDKMICNDNDFKTACSIIETLKEHSLYAFEQLIPKKAVVTGPGALYGTNREVFDSLPDTFERKTAIAIVNGRIAERSLDRLLASSLFTKTAYGRFKKIKHV